MLVALSAKSSCSNPLKEGQEKSKFLKCQSCEAVLFWSDRTATWEAPKAPSDPSIPLSPAKVTEYPCPVCRKPLEEYSYQKDGQSKVMLRCSDTQARQQKKHQGAVYFATAKGFWSPKFGAIGSAKASAESKPQASTRKTRRK